MQVISNAHTETKDEAVVTDGDARRILLRPEILCRGAKPRLEAQSVSSGKGPWLGQAFNCTGSDAQAPELLRPDSRIFLAPSSVFQITRGENGDLGKSPILLLVRAFCSKCRIFCLVSYLARSLGPCSYLHARTLVPEQARTTIATDLAGHSVGEFLLAQVVVRGLYRPRKLRALPR
jgi:hypothetical protein